MYKLPYDRKELLVKEIRGFLKALEVNEIIEEDLIFEGKEKADKRFPDFEKIQKFVAGQEKTEAFLKNLRYSVENIQTHFRTEYADQFKVSFDAINGIIQLHDEVLLEALSELGYDGTDLLGESQWPELELSYSEKPNRYLVSSAEELLEMIGKLSVKIEKFIKVNNLYGTNHKIKPRDKFKVKGGKEPDYKDELEACIERVDKILHKKYEVDIFDDGSTQITEMLTALWNSIEMIMRAPVLSNFSDYLVEGNYLSSEDCFDRLSEISSSRYERINTIIDADSFLHDKSEDELLDLYDKMVALDQWGYMNVNGANMIHIGASEKQLNTLIGLSSVKESIAKIKAYALANKGADDLNVHMCFYGNPGTGKTEVARIIAGILHENGILPTSKVVEVDRSGLVGQYVGETPQKTMRKINEAMGGVLFVDEAYALVPKDGGGWDFGHEAIATLIKAMEDYRGKFCVILAGYKNPMLNMLSTNPGFQSRIQFTLDFPNYSRDELKHIAELMLKKRGYSIMDAAMAKILDITDVKRKNPNFANAREIRNILDQVIMCQNIRVNGSDDKELGVSDVNKYIKDSGINLPTSNDGRVSKILTGEEELDQLIGLASVKRMIKKIKAYAKKNKGDAGFNLHMCFYGNPGTGKTEVARILSRIMYEAGVLPESKLVETDAHGLIGKYVGETAPKTEDKINDAMNGVLFIDEAYGLADDAGSGGNSGYGDEAIEVLLKEMEDHRGQFCVILAGYKDEMKKMIGANPGLASRIQFTLDFPDYSRDELGEIAQRFLSVKRYEITADALERVLDITEYFRALPNFANARTVRNILDQVIMNQNLRTEDVDGDMTIVIDDVEDYLMDEGIDLNKKPKSQGKSIGFI